MVSSPKQTQERRCAKTGPGGTTSKEMQEETFLGYSDFLGIHDRFIRDEKFRKNMVDIGRNEELCREMDKLANEDHTHHITPDEVRVYRNNWWIFSNIVSSDTMPVRHRPDFKQALTSLRQLKRIQLITKSCKALPHPGGTGKNPGGILHLSITATMDPALIDRGNLRKQ